MYVILNYVYKSVEKPSVFVKYMYIEEKEKRVLIVCSLLQDIIHKVLMSDLHKSPDHLST